MNTKSVYHHSWYLRNKESEKEKARLWRNNNIAAVKEYKSCYESDNRV